MNYSKLAYDCLVGGIIGSFTNWLAIKMLFRPHNEKFFLGVKIPFTPGLIPKEIGRISSSIGRTIGNEILDGKTLLNELNNFDLKNKLNLFIDKRISEYTENDKSIDDLLNDLFGEKKEAFLKSITNTLTQTICKLDIDIKSISSKLIVKTLNSEKQLTTFIPEYVDSYINQAIHDKTPEIINSFKDVLASETVEIKIKSKIDSHLNNSKLLMLVRNFLNSDTIYNLVKPELITFLDDEELKQMLETKLLEFKNSVLETKICDFIKDEEKSNLSDSIGNLIEQKVNSYLASEDFKLLLTKKVEEILSNLLNVKINTIVNEKYNAQYIKFKNYLIEHLNSFIYNNFSKVLGHIDIEKIVERRVSAFSMETTEKLILDICGKELKAINLLEGGIGALMGIMSSLLVHFLHLG